MDNRENILTNNQQLVIKWTKEALMDFLIEHTEPESVYNQEDIL